MTHKPILALRHKFSLSVGGIVRYRIQVQPSQLSAIETLQFRIRNCSPVYRNITPSSGPWKISVALIRNPDKAPVVPELVPSISCATVCRLDAAVDCDANQFENMWELEVLSEMVLQSNWIDIKVEVYVVPREGAAELVCSNPTSDADDSTTDYPSDVTAAPQLLLPTVLSCDYKNTEAICGPAYPERTQTDSDLHLVILTHGIHGTWLDMLYIKEQIDARNAGGGKTVTFLTDTNHAGTEEGIQMAGQRVALDILEFTGYCDTEHGKELGRSLSVVARKQSLSKSKQSNTASAESGPGSPATTHRRHPNSKTFPRGFSKVSIIGHSLGGLINIYALGYIEDLTHGAFFDAIQPVHFITLATPLLGVGFEHPWVLEFALSLGVVGQTGKDLALGDRSSKLKRSASTSSSVFARKPQNASSSDKESVRSPHSSALSNGEHSPQPCALDKSHEPLLLAMARPGSVSHRILKQFKDRTSYANIENDMAVRFKTSSMMGIPTFDMDQFFSPEGAATQPRRSLYRSALTSAMALLFPNVPSKAKFRGIADAPSPIVVVSHVDAEPLTNKDDTSSSSPPLSPSPSSSSASLTKSKQDLAQLVAEGYQTEMDWTKIGVFIEHEAHVQIVVRRKWYNLDGWKCVEDLVERFDFT
ncbi:putative serine esterase-domain-containing protein [Mortierella sp. GBAus27b]|nr:putative serine esterase-domain-containing protein [Mortierella sp. GBAus27b]